MAVSFTLGKFIFELFGNLFQLDDKKGLLSFYKCNIKSVHDSELERLSSSAWLN